MDLSALADFNRVAAHRGFGRASRMTGRSKATLSRHVADLEQQLGVRLVERDGRAFNLTEEGKALFARTDGLLTDVRQIAEELSSGRATPRGKLRISAPSTFAVVGMGRIAAEFALNFPEVEVEVTVEDRLVNLIEENYDLVIRADPPPDSELVGRCFQRHQRLVVAAPSVPRPAAADDEACVAGVVGVTAPELDRWSVMDGDREYSLQRKAALRLSTPVLRRDAALAGAGVAVLAEDLVRDDLSAGRLCNWGSLKGGTVELWVLHTSRRLVSRKVAAFVDFICQASRPGL